MNPLVSIIIPVFNAKSYAMELAECLQRQTYTHYEVIWVDDHSTDGTLEALQSYNDKRFLCYKRPIEMSKGGQSCRNYGMDIAKGEYMIIIDSDDLVQEFFVEQRVSAMQKHPEMDFCIFPAYSFNDGDPERKPQFWWGKPNGMGLMESFLCDRYQYTVWTNIYKSSFINQIRWDERIKLHQDLDFNISTLLLKPRLMFIEDAKPDYLYRRYAGSVSKNFFTKEKLHSTFYLWDKIWKCLELSKAENEENRKYLWQYVMGYFQRNRWEGKYTYGVEIARFVMSHYGLWVGAKLWLGNLIEWYYPFSIGKWRLQHRCIEY